MTPRYKDKKNLTEFPEILNACDLISNDVHQEYTPRLDVTRVQEKAGVLPAYGGDPRLFSAHPLFHLVLYLTPGEVPSHRDVLAFDWMDLIGIVGGFMGLFLGWSVLSLARGVLVALGMERAGWEAGRVQPWRNI